MELVSQGRLWKSCSVGQSRLVLKEALQHSSPDEEGEQDILPNGDLQPLCPGQVSPLRGGSTQDTTKLSALPERVPSGGDKSPGPADVGGTDTSQTPQHMGIVWGQHCLSKALLSQWLQ